jgi:hypothetical protein
LHARFYRGASRRCDDLLIDAHFPREVDLGLKEALEVAYVDQQGEIYKVILEKA